MGTIKTVGIGLALVLAAGCSTLNKNIPVDQDTMASVAISGSKGTVTVTSASCGPIASCACNVEQGAVACKALPVVADFILQQTQGK
jgi:hypothetical protein